MLMSSHGREGLDFLACSQCCTQQMFLFALTDYVDARAGNMETLNPTFEHPVRLVQQHVPCSVTTKDGQHPNTIPYSNPQSHVNNARCGRHRQPKEYAVVILSLLLIHSQCLPRTRCTNTTQNPSQKLKSLILLIRLSFHGV